MLHEAYAVRGGPVQDKFILTFDSASDFNGAKFSIWDRRSNLGGVELINGVEEYRFNMNLDVRESRKNQYEFLYH